MMRGGLWTNVFMMRREKLSLLSRLNSYNQVAAASTLITPHPICNQVLSALKISAHRELTLQMKEQAVVKECLLVVRSANSNNRGELS